MPKCPLTADITPAHQVERRPIFSKVFAPVRETDITKAKAFQCLGKRISFPSRVSCRGYKIGPVCVSVCLLVSALTVEPFELQTWNLAETLSLIISRTSSKVKVIGQRSRSPFWKKKHDFPIFSYGVNYVDCTEPFCHDTWCYVMSRHNVMTSRDVMAWHLDTFWWLLGKNTDKKGTSREGASTLRRQFHWNYSYNRVFLRR